MVHGNLGIGIINPGYSLHINKPNASIGFYDSDADDHFAGFIQADSQNLLINAHRRPNVFPVTGTPGDLILQVNSSGPFANATAGNVGIGIANPDTKVHITNGTEATATGGGFLQLGFTDNTNLAFDNNEIQARFNGSATKMYLQFDGGGIQFGNGAGTVNITAAGEIQRNSITGTANLLPFAYGRIAWNGTVLSSTGNFTVQKGNEGEYKITLTGETNVYQNRNNYVIMVTPYLVLGLNAQSYIANAGIAENNLINVYLSKPRVLYTNSSCSGDCGPFSYVHSSSAREVEDVEFNILIYKY